MLRPAPKTDLHRLWTDESQSLTNDDSATNGSADAKYAQTLIESVQNNLCVQQMSVSAGMVGVCLTVIGLFRLVQNLNQMGTIVDDLVAINSMLF